jgi:transposase
MEYGGGMNELPYPSDLTAAQWALIEPLLPAPKPKGRKRRVDLRKLRWRAACPNILTHSSMRDVASC